MFSCTVEVQTTQEGRREAAVRIRGKATIEHAREMWESVRSGFEQAGRLRMEVGDVSEADLSLVQIVLSGLSWAKAQGKSFVLNGQLKGRLGSIFKEAGVAPIETRHEE